MEYKEKCKHCQSDLEWEDTFRHEGGIQEGYLIEHQIWTCPNCQKDYIINKRVDFDESKIIYMEEN